MKVKVFKCIYCENKYVDKKALYEHMQKQHSDNLPQGMTVAQHLFNVRNNKTHGSCIMCSKETKWNEKTEKYERLCSQKCQDDFRAMFKNRMINTHGKVHLLDDPTQQRKMLANRKISGEYRWSDGTKKNYTGSYELDFLKVCDKILNLSSQDVLLPAPMTFNYKDSEGKERFYIPDAYIVSLNTIVEIKDGGDNPNRHHKIQDVDKVKEKIKDDIMRKQKQYNYVKVTNKNYAILLNFLLDLKDQQLDENAVKLPIVRIEEAVTLAKHKLFTQTPMIMCESTSGLIGDLEKLNLINENVLLLQENVLSESNMNSCYHLSANNLDGHTLNPKVPKNFFTENGFEDNKIKRVCFTPTIDQCLMGMSQNLTKKQFFVHVPDGMYKTKKPTLSQVPDSKITNEIWIEEPVKLKCIGTIEVSGDDGLDGKKFKYGGKYEAELYGWKWNWIKKMSESTQVDIDSKSVTIMQTNYDDLKPRKLYGIPDTKQFPLNTAEEVERAIKNYMRGPSNKRKILANNICQRSHELGVAIKETSLLWNYADWKRPSEIDKDMLQENETVSKKHKLYHLSTENVNEQIFKPRIPDNWRTQNGFEDKTIPRVCFSTSIDGCLVSLSAHLDLASNEYYVFEPEDVDKLTITRPLKSQVPDCVLSSEVWVKSPVKMKLVGKIRVEKSSDTMGYTVKNMYSEVVKYDWKWINNLTEGNFEQAYEELVNSEEKEFEDSQNAFFDLLQENFTIDSDGSMIIKLREKTDFMSRYNLSHRLLKIYYKTDNIEGVKAELARLYYMYEIIEYYYVNGENNGVSKLHLRILSKNKAEALKAKPFILNDFTTGLKFVLEKEKDFNFQNYFMKTDYYNDVVKLDVKKIKGIKALIKAILV